MMMPAHGNVINPATGASEHELNTIVLIAGWGRNLRGRAKVLSWSRFLNVDCNSTTYPENFYLRNSTEKRYVGCLALYVHDTAFTEKGDEGAGVILARGRRVTVFGVINIEQVSWRTQTKVLPQPFTYLKTAEFGDWIAEQTGIPLI